MTDLRKRIEEAAEKQFGSKLAEIKHYEFMPEIADFAHEQVLDQIRRDGDKAPDVCMCPNLHVDNREYIERHDSHCPAGIRAAILAQIGER